MAAGGLALMAAGCSSDLSMFRADWNWWSRGTRPAPMMQSAPPDALVNADGSCPGGAAQPRGIALGMTECELVAVAGPTDQIAVAANERGERTVVITYPQGERAGIYRFVSGLLVTIDRVDPPAPTRPQKRAPQKKPPPAPPRGY